MSDTTVIDNDEDGTVLIDVSDHPELEAGEGTAPAAVTAKPSGLPERALLSRMASPCAFMAMPNSRLLRGGWVNGSNGTTMLNPDR